MEVYILNALSDSGGHASRSPTAPIEALGELQTLRFNRDGAIRIIEPSSVFVQHVCLFKPPQINAHQPQNKRRRDFESWDIFLAAAHRRDNPNFIASFDEDLLSAVGRNINVLKIYRNSTSFQHFVGDAVIACLERLEEL